jgi:probable HAF family extracellular repeat protein
MQDVGDLDGGIWSHAMGINDSGQVVGRSYVGSGSYVSGSGRAFLYDSTSGMQDLNGLIPADSGWTIYEATAINSKGMIAATGYKDGVGTHALLLTPTSSDSPPPPADTEAPTVKDSSLMPASGATNVSTSTGIGASFSEMMDPKTLVTTPTDPADPTVGTSTTVTLVKDGTTTPIRARIDLFDSNKRVSLTPSPALTKLDRNKKYTVTIKGGTNGVKDLAGNPLANDYTWSFTTGRQ